MSDLPTPISGHRGRFLSPLDPNFLAIYPLVNGDVAILEDITGLTVDPLLLPNLVVTDDYTVRYDGTEWIVVDQDTGGGSTGVCQLLRGDIFVGDVGVDASATIVISNGDTSTITYTYNAIEQSEVAGLGSDYVLIFQINSTADHALYEPKIISKSSTGFVVEVQKQNVADTTNVTLNYQLQGNCTNPTQDLSQFALFKHAFYLSGGSTAPITTVPDETEILLNSFIGNAQPVYAAGNANYSAAAGELTIAETGAWNFEWTTKGGPINGNNTARFRPRLNQYRAAALISSNGLEIIDGELSTVNGHIQIYAEAGDIIRLYHYWSNLGANAGDPMYSLFNRFTGHLVKGV